MKSSALFSFPSSLSDSPFPPTALPGTKAAVGLFSWERPAALQNLVHLRSPSDGF